MFKIGEECKVEYLKIEEYYEQYSSVDIVLILIDQNAIYRKNYDFDG